MAACCRVLLFLLQNEYMELTENCKTFAFDVLDLCRTDAEVMAALHGNKDQRDLSRIRQAIKYNQKKVQRSQSVNLHGR